MFHVLCGECAGTDVKRRAEGREAIKKGLQRARGVLTRKGRGGAHAMTTRRQQTIGVIAAAQRALAKGTRATAEERAAMTQWMAGCLPPATGENAAGVKHVTRQVAEAVRQSQRGAAALRALWTEDGRAERNRRATREGGREGGLWKGVGWEVWKCGARGLRLAEDEAETDANRRNGWTMAAALIVYRRRQLEKAEARRTAQRDTQEVRVDREGNGVLSFDLETTTLIEDDIPVRAMKVSVACAAWAAIRADGTVHAEHAQTLTCWHAEVTRAPGGGEVHRVETLLQWMDTAKVIVAYNGRAFDMEVLKQHYGGDEERWRRHMAKLHDPMEEVRRVAGRRVRLSTVLALNKMGGKGGTGCDAPRWWQEGRWEQLERYCARDVQAVLELVVRDKVKVASHTIADEVSVITKLRKDSARAAAADGTATGGTAVGCDEEETESPGAGDKRARTVTGGGYDETARRQRQRTPRGGTAVQYVEKRTYTGAKRTAIVMGAAAMERVVRGRYEWRDAREQPVATVGSKRKLYWEDEERCAAQRREEADREGEGPDVQGGGTSTQRRAER
jgi:uncharacterized protein YprB with RNaseH-like and TPR domain